MDIIISNNTIEYESFMKLKTLSEAVSTVGRIGILVYHKSNEKVEDKVEYLTSLKDRVSTFVYIRDRDHYEQAIQMIVIGLGGKYFDDEFFLESNAELLNLVKNLDKVTSLVELGGVGVVNDFFNRYLKEGSSGFSKHYLNIVKSAVSGMITDYRKKDLELIKMSETATEIFSNSMSIISGVEEEKRKLQESVAKLEKMKEDVLVGDVAPVSQSNVFFFPRVSYPKERDIIRIKEVGNCPFLVSFFLGFRRYMESVKYLRVKLIFLYPVGDQYEKNYSSFQWLTQGNAKTMAPYGVSTVFVNYPNKESIFRLLDDNNFDLFVIVDRLKFSETHLINSKGSLKYAVSGNSVIDRYKLRANQCMSASYIAGAQIFIKYDGGYPKEASQRERYYMREYSGVYDLLYSTRKG